METNEGRNVKKNVEAESKVVSMSREEKKELVQTEENVLKKDIKDLKTWNKTMETNEGRNVKKAGSKVVSMSREEKKELAQREENILKKDIEDLETWVDLMETMDDKQLEDYLQNNPDDSKKPRDQKMKKKVQSTSKSKSSNSTGIMASVWKFDKNLN